MEKKEQIEDMKKRVENLWERAKEMDAEAISLIHQKDGVMEEYTPLEAALVNLNHKFQRLSLQKDVILREIGKATNTLVALEGEEKAGGYIQ